MGSQAKEVGLIDDVGTLDDAVDWAAERAGIPAKTVTLRPRRSLAQLVLGRAAGALVEAVQTAAPGGGVPAIAGRPLPLEAVGLGAVGLGTVGLGAVALGAVADRWGPGWERYDSLAGATER